MVARARGWWPTACCLLLLVACGKGDQQAATSTPDTAAPTPPAAATTGIMGLDVSKYQGQIDFAAVAGAGYRYVLVKATQGVDYIDPNFKTNYQQAKAAGLLVGAYHYYMTDDEPEPQFQNFSGNAGLLSGDLPPVVDIEALAKNSLPDLAQNLQQFLEQLEQHHGVKPIIYTGENFANQYLNGLGAYPLWLAEYGVDSPTLPHGWQTWTFWQYSQSTTVAGIEGKVDGDRFNGDEAALKALLIP